MIGFIIATIFVIASVLILYSLIFALRYIFFPSKWEPIKRDWTKRVIRPYYRGSGLGGWIEVEGEMEIKRNMNLNQKMELISLYSFIYGLILSFLGCLVIFTTYTTFFTVDCIIVVIYYIQFVVDVMQAKPIYRSFKNDPEYID